MNLAFCLFKYFPYGGLQRDCLRIARECQRRGHQIHIYTMSSDGELDPGMHLHLIAASGWQNHTRCWSFIQQLKQQLDRQPHQLVIGFNKMPNLDIYYAADVCYQARIHEQRSKWYRLLPRYQYWLECERSVFAVGHPTKILLISPKQESAFKHYYQTEAPRFHLLTPGIARDRIAPANALSIRAQVRKAYELKNEQLLLLLVGSGFKTKGLDRAILGLSALPSSLKQKCQLFVIGQDQPKVFITLAQRLQVADQVHFLGGRADVTNFFLAADLLLHPAYHDNTGTVLLEAMVAGLPSLTVDCCGYAHYVKDARTGVVLPSPFQQSEFNFALQKMLLSTAERQEWRNNGLAFAQYADIYQLPTKAADFIESVGRERELHLTSQS